MNLLTKYIHHHQGMIVALILCIISIVGLVFGVVPLAKKTELLYRRHKTLTQEVKTLMVKRDLLASLDEATLRSTLTTLLGAVPQDVSIASILTTVDGLASETGVTISDLIIAHPGGIATESARRKTASERKLGVGVTQFSFMASGTLSQLESLFSRLVMTRRVITLETVSITRQSSLFRARITMKTYHSSLPTSVGSIEKEIQPLTDSENRLITRVSQKKVFDVAPQDVSEVLASPGDPFSR